MIHSIFISSGKCTFRLVDTNEFKLRADPVGVASQTKTVIPNYLREMYTRCLISWRLYYKHFLNSYKNLSTRRSQARLKVAMCFGPLSHDAHNPRNIPVHAVITAFFGFCDLQFVLAVLERDGSPWRDCYMRYGSVLRPFRSFIYTRILFLSWLALDV